MRQLALLTLLVVSGFLRGEESTPSTVIDTQQVFQQTAQASQQQINDLDDATLEMLSAFNTETERLNALEVYNENLRNMLANQDAEKRRIEKAFRKLEVTRREIVPLMTEMISVLDQFVSLDQPMLLDERQARLESLNELMSRSDTELAEKYRRILESYQIEAEYGQTIEAYEGEVELDDRLVTVDFLRVGRIALYYVTFDRAQAGIWDPEQSVWQALDDSHLDNLDQALRVARKQAPPNLLPLPLWTPAS